MKKLYLLLFASYLVSLSGFAQEKPSTPPREPNYRALLTRPRQDSLKQKDIEDFRLFPNPVTNGVVTVHTRKNRLKAISIYDVLGKEVLHTKINGKTLNVSALNAGIYIIKVSEERNTTIRKLVIK